MRILYLQSIVLLTLLNTPLDAIEWTIVCSGDSRFSQLSVMDYTFGAEDDPDMLPLLMGEADPVNSDMPVWDDTSPACGGDGEENVLLFKGCNYGANNCFDVELGDLSGFNVIDYDDTTGEYYNTVPFVNGLPCVPHNTDKLGVGTYNWNDNTNFGIASVQTPDHRDTLSYELTNEDREIQKRICGGDGDSGGDYTEQLNKIIENTSTNSIATDKLTSIDARGKSLDTKLNSVADDNTLTDILDTTTDTEEFSDTFETTLNDTFETYSDIFGIGGYGSAPSSIDFSCCGRSYTLFDVNLISPYVDMIRAVFLLFGYLWGFIIVFRSI